MFDENAFGVSDEGKQFVTDTGEGWIAADIKGDLSGCAANGDPAPAWATARAPSAAVRPRSEVKILAPIQPPPQMRDASVRERPTASR